MQTKKRSAIESGVMTIIGIGYAVPLNWVLINHVTWSSAWSQAFWITFWFTVLSFILKYCVRRFFTWFDDKYPPTTTKPTCEMHHGCLVTECTCERRREAGGS